MNRSKLIYLVLLVVSIAATIAVLQARKKHHHEVMTKTEQIGHDLITVTNSAALDRLGWGLHQKLHEFLDADTRVSRVQLGDEEPPVGNGTAASRVFLTNGRGQVLGIRFREDFNSFHVVGFWDVNAHPNQHKP